MLTTNISKTKQIISWYAQMKIKKSGLQFYLCKRSESCATKIRFFGWGSGKCPSFLSSRYSSSVHYAKRCRKCQTFPPMSSGSPIRPKAAFSMRLLNLSISFVARWYAWLPRSPRRTIQLHLGNRRRWVEREKGAHSEDSRALSRHEMLPAMRLKNSL